MYPITAYDSSNVNIGNYPVDQYTLSSQYGVGNLSSLTTSDTVDITTTVSTVYNWEQTNTQDKELPSLTGSMGFLYKDGTQNLSWNNKPLTDNATGQGSLGIGPGIIASGTYSTIIGNTAQSSKSYAIAIGNNTYVHNQSGLAIGTGAVVNANYAIQLGNRYGSGTNQKHTNSDANTFKVGNSNGNFEIMSADGTIPADRLPNSINKYSTMPTAASGNLGWIVQYTGTTDANYTHGYIYECVSDGGNPATYSWTAVQVQAGGSSLPSQTGKTGQVLTTDGTNASWTTKALKNVASHSESIIVGPSANVTTTDGGQNAVLGEYAILASTSVRGATIVGSGKEGGEVLAGWYSTAIGNKAQAGGATEATQSNAIAIGSYAKANSLGSIQLGYGTNNDANTLKVGQQINNQWQNYELLSAGGTIPTDRFTTTPSSAGSYVPTITVDGQGAVTRSWATPSGGASMSYNPTTRTLTFS